MNFSAEEYNVVSNSRLLLVKADVVAKVRAEFEGLQTMYSDIVKTEGIILPKTAVPKISRGENYKGLPYLVLDFPAVFERDDILAFRTMFWWGNFFSITLHLQGKYKEQFQHSIEQHLHENNHRDYFYRVTIVPGNTIMGRIITGQLKRLITLQFHHS